MTVQYDNTKRLSSNRKVIFNCSLALEFSKLDAHL